MLKYTHPKAYLPDFSLDSAQLRFKTMPNGYRSYQGSRAWASTRPAGLLLLQHGIETLFSIVARLSMPASRESSTTRPARLASISARAAIVQRPVEQDALVFRAQVSATPLFSD